MAKQKNNRPKISSALITRNGSDTPSDLNILTNHSTDKKESGNKVIKKSGGSTQEKVTEASILYQTPDYDFSALANLYDMNSYHSRCCELKAGVTTLLGYTIYNSKDEKIKGSGNKDYEMINEFMRKTIDDLNNFQLDHEIFGNGFMEVVRDGKGDPTGLYHIPGKDCKIAIKENKRILVQNLLGKQIEYIPFMGENYEKDPRNRREYLHLRNYNPKNYFYGRPSYIPAVKVMFLDDNSNDFNIGKFNNNAVPDSIIKLYGFEKDAQTEKDIKGFFQNNFKGKENYGKALLLWADNKELNEIEIDKMNQDIKEGSYRGLRQDNRDEVLSAHGVPPALVGVSIKGRLGAGSEVSAQLDVFSDTIIVPRQKRLARILNRIIKEGFGIEDWEIKFDTFEFSNISESADYFIKLVTAGIIGPDIAAQELGYEPPEKTTKDPLTKAESRSALLRILKQIQQIAESGIFEDKEE